ncbi:MAG: aminotransferase class V-fold PLP-dependent enzyme [Chloroflexota bacterium]
MIYLDNAATSWPKAPGVAAAMTAAVEQAAGNPGRGAHRLALAAGRTVERTRLGLAQLLGVKDPSRVVFTANTTTALNLALKGLIRGGDHVVTTSMEHNSVTRPLHALAQRLGVRVDKAPAGPDGRVRAADMIALIKPTTRLVVMTHASNVCGALQPVAEVGAACRRLGVPLLVDAAQTVGTFPVLVEELGADLLAFPGHKGLLGPTGTGGLYIAPGIDLATSIEGGTGTVSESPEQPSQCPDRYEAGTVNVVGLAGLGAAVEYLAARGLADLRQHEQALADRLRRGIAAMDGVSLVGPQPDAAVEDAPVVSAVVTGRDSGEVALVLDRKYDIAVRSGLHCSPDAHRTLGTLESGTIRFSIGPFNTADEIDAVLAALRNIAAGETI